MLLPLGLAERRKEYLALLEESLAKVKEKLEGKAERILLFGSYPQRKDLFADLDIIVVMRTEKPFLERQKEVYSLLSLPVDADILCYTPEEFKRVEKKFPRGKLLLLYEERSA